ncbi:hypothetical protein HYE05_02945 [Mycoplasmopsis bovis]|nr:hypothetical protein [Mycoplasmopsis bovis]QQH27614.1 hypothetical protein HYE05_02945 [Mycoplasmopsis bovis]
MHLNKEDLLITLRKLISKNFVTHSDHNQYSSKEYFSWLKDLTDSINVRIATFPDDQ